MWKKQEFRTPRICLLFDFSVRRCVLSVCFSSYSSCGRQSNYSNICKITEKNRSGTICWTLLDTTEFRLMTVQPKINRTSKLWLSKWDRQLWDHCTLLVLSWFFLNFAFATCCLRWCSSSRMTHPYTQQKVCTVRKMSATRTGWKETGE